MVPSATYLSALKLHTKALSREVEAHKANRHAVRFSVSTSRFLSRSASPGSVLFFQVSWENLEDVTPQVRA
jgi:hypothetical protein